MIPLPSDPNASHFWSLAATVDGVDWLLLLALLLTLGGGLVAGYWLGWWDAGRTMTAAGAQLSPADGAASAAAAPAPGAPVGRAGAPGVTPDGFPWFASASRSVREAEQAAEVEAMVGGGR